MKYKKTIFIISLIPLILLFALNVNQTTLFSKTGLSRGFIEDYPALWLASVGIIVFLNLLHQYYLLIKQLRLELFKHITGFSKSYVFVLNAIRTFAILFFTHLINQRWISSQLNDNKITWITYGGSIPNAFDKSFAEYFNLAGFAYSMITFLFYSISLLLLTMVLYSVILILLFMIKSSILSIFRFSNNKTLIKIYKSYITFTSFILFCFIIYCVSLQINNIIIDGHETFWLHPNRSIMIIVITSIMISYFTVLTYIRHFTDLRTKRIRPILSYIKSELSYELNLIIFPFLLLTLYTFLMNLVLRNDTYEFKIISSFFIFITIFCVLIINFFFKKVSLANLRTLDEENKRLVDYTNTVENLYKETRKYKHDIKNTLISLGYFIKKDDLEGLKSYFTKEITNKSPISQPLYKLVAQLEKIEDIHMKAMLLYKLCSLNPIEYTISLEIYDYIPLLNVDSKNLISILSIMLENSIESAQYSLNKNITISVSLDQNKSDQYVFTIASNYLSSSDLDKLIIKNKYKGIGRPSIKRLVSNNFNIHFETSVDPIWFVQRITVVN